MALRKTKIKQTKIENRKIKRLVVFLVVMLLLLAVVGAAALATAAEAGSDKIIRNVYVDGVRIGGMKTAEAVAALEQEFSNRRITVDLGENSRTFTLDELGIRYKTDALVGEAYELGKSGDFAEKVLAICRSFVLPQRFSSSEALVSAEISAEVREYLESFSTLPTESTYSIEDDKVVVTNGENGCEADIGRLLELIGEITDFDSPIEVPVNIIPFEQPNVDDIYLRTAVNPHAPYGRNSDGSVTATVKNFNLDAAREIQKNNTGEGAVYEFLIDTESVAPLPDEALYPDVLGERTTEFDTGYVTRSKNIKIAADLLNGAELLPGETFSFNDHNGDITAEKGYQVARGYSNGTVVDTVGAGVCQVSSTLYNAALYSNMEIVRRSNHSLPVAYLPLGQDAAISYPTQDFKFKNSSSAPIKIFASVDGGKLTVQIRGQNDDSFSEIKIENNTLSVIEPTTKEVTDDSLSPGKRVVKQRGTRGYVVESFRVVYKDGAVIKRENLGKSTYKAQNTVVNVGPIKEEPADEQDNQL
ncbi:MAG: VanW family protein [Oscillospiraceae bacterium]|nr:VanW family protein [Oscillospiraceae bacterium]